MTGTDPLATTAGRVFAAVVAASAWFGLTVQFRATLHANGSAAAALWIPLRYFTILVALALALAFSGLALRLRTISAAVLGGLTLNVLFVAIVYHLLLAGTLVQTHREKLADLVLHGVTPSLVLLFWLVHVPRGALRYGDVAPWATAPLVYFACALARGAADRVYPYPFIDIGRIGWAATGLDAALIAAGFLVAGVGLVWADRRLVPRPDPAARDVVEPAPPPC